MSSLSSECARLVAIVSHARQRRQGTICPVYITPLCSVAVSVPCTWYIRRSQIWQPPICTSSSMLIICSSKWPFDRATYGHLTVSDCADDVCCRFMEYGLLLNPAETELILFGTRTDRKRKNSTSVDVVEILGTKHQGWKTREWKSQEKQKYGKRRF